MGTIQVLAMVQYLWVAVVHSGLNITDDLGSCNWLGPLDSSNYSLKSWLVGARFDSSGMTGHLPATYHLFSWRDLPAISLSDLSLPFSPSFFPAEEPELVPIWELGRGRGRTATVLCSQSHYCKVCHCRGFICVFMFLDEHREKENCLSFQYLKKWHFRTGM